MARKPPSPNTLKKLFALSGNCCAYNNGREKCKNMLVDADGNLVGQICHIEAAEPGGERFNLQSDDEYRRSFDNLILLCANHHIVTNDVARYTVSVLREMKQRHESQYLGSPFDINETILKEAVNQLSLHIGSVQGDINIYHGITLEEYENEKKNNLSIDEAVQFYVATQKKYLEKLNTPLGYYDSTEYVGMTGNLKDNRAIELDFQINPITYFRKATAKDQKGLNSIDILGSDKKKLISDTYKFLTTSNDIVILLGEPGSGKSVTLRQLALDYIKNNQKLPNSKALVPIYLQLGSYNQLDENGAPADILKFIKYQLKNVIDGGYVIADHLEVLLKKMQVVLLFDSMDEMPSADYLARSEKIKAIIKEYGATNKIIVACRVREYSGELKQAELIIEPFDSKHIKVYLDKAWEIHAPHYLDDKDQVQLKDKFYSLANEESVFYPFLSNPFFIKLVTTYFFANTGLMPDSISDVLHNYIRQKLLREIQTGNLKDIDEVDEVLSILSALSFGMLIENYGSYIDINHDLVNIRHLSSFDDNTIRKSIFVAVKSNLARKEADNSFRFAHHRILEYFAAWYWLVNKNEEPLNAETLQNPWMRETLLLRAGLEHNASEFCLELIKIIAPKLSHLRSEEQHSNITSLNLELIGLVEILMSCAHSHWQRLSETVKSTIVDISKYIAAKGTLVSQVRLARLLRYFEVAEFKEVYLIFAAHESDWLGKELFQSFTARQCNTPEFKEFFRIFCSRLNSDSISRLSFLKYLPDDISWIKLMISSRQSWLKLLSSLIFSTAGIMVAWLVVAIFVIPRLHIGELVIPSVFCAVGLIILFTYCRPFLLVSLLTAVAMFFLNKDQPYKQAYTLVSMSVFVFAGFAVTVIEDYRRAGWNRFNIFYSFMLILSQQYVFRVSFFSAFIMMFVGYSPLFQTSIFQRLLYSLAIGLTVELLVYSWRKWIARSRIQRSRNLNAYQKLQYLTSQLKKPFASKIYDDFINEIEKTRLDEQTIIYHLNDLLESNQSLVKPEKVLEVIDKLDLRRRQKAVRNLADPR